MKYKVTPNDRVRVMREEDFIISKTDLKGKITYANRIFMEFSFYKEEDLIGVQHNVVRHPDMPRAIFKLLWDTIISGKEIFAYVKNLAGDGSSYWVFANISPVVDEKGKVIGYCSVRRKPKTKALDVIIPLYKSMVVEEKRNETRNQVETSTKLLNNLLQEKGLNYEEFILSI
jgi:PAS domain S-box-containing protein